jgi:predicted SprT family Zn-dependent metalloprotease
MTITDPTTIPTDQREHLSFLASYARDLMNEHGMGHVPFEWDRGVRRWGAMHWLRNRLTGEVEAKKLTLSAPICALNTLDACEDVILHEIAHFHAGHAAGHGPRWKAEARRIGADPTRCYETDKTNTPQALWTGKCPDPECDFTLDRHRLTERSRVSSCPSPRHGRRGYKAEFQIIWRKNRR